MKRQPVNLRLPRDLVARVDAAAGALGQTRTKFVERALEAALRGVPTGKVAAREFVEHHAGPAPVLDQQGAAMERQRLMNKAKGL